MSAEVKAFLINGDDVPMEHMRFFATYGTTTNADIEAAYQAGKICACKYNGYTYYLVERGDAAEHVFACVDGSYMRVVFNTSGTWGHDEFDILPTIPEAYTSNPAALGTASPGSSTKYAKGDHVHPKPSAADLGVLPTAGGTMSGAIAMGSNKITGLADGTADGDAVNLAQVSGLISTNTAFFRGSFATKAAMLAVAWQTTNPAGSYYVTNNDYAVVLDDESQSDECWRYVYVAGTGWQAQYRINESPLTTAQLAALNSGATASNISSIADKIDKPSSPATGAFLVWNGSAWTAQTLAVWQGGSY